MKISSKLVKIFNFLILILFLAPALKLDLFHENYSTLSLDTRGYFFLLFLGIICGSIMSYETNALTGKRNALIMFLALFLGTVMPHHVPYDLQGNLHLLLAYTGFFLLICITYINTVYDPDRRYRDLLYLTIMIVSLLYMKYMMVNTLAEIIIMAVCMTINMVLYLKKKGQ